VVVLRCWNAAVRSGGSVEQLGAWLSHRWTDDGRQRTGRGTPRGRELRLSARYPDDPRAWRRHRRRSWMPAAGPDAWRVSWSHHCLILHCPVAEGKYWSTSENFVLLGAVTMLLDKKELLKFLRKLLRSESISTHAYCWWFVIHLGPRSSLQIH